MEGIDEADTHIDDADDVDGGAVHLTGRGVNGELNVIVSGAPGHRDDGAGGQVEAGVGVGVGVGRAGAAKGSTQAGTQGSRHDIRLII